jgi:16S rRNA U516 pseudouridylate synthase RsuA-like enzyme
MQGRMFGQLGRRVLMSVRFFHASRPALDEITVVPRISKRIAMAGKYSRREAEELIKGNRVTVNGKKAELWTKVNLGDCVRLDGAIVPGPQCTRIFLAHKLRGEIVSRDDPLGRRTIMERMALMGVPRPLFTVVRDLL